VRASLTELARRREELIARAEVQRAQLSLYGRQFHAPLRVAETVYRFGKTLRQSPLAVTALAALLTRTPWRRLGRVPKLIWRTWRILRFVQSWAR
jgi:hypothetical protein